MSETNWKLDKILNIPLGPEKVKFNDPSSAEDHQAEAKRVIVERRMIGMLPSAVVSFSDRRKDHWRDAKQVSFDRPDEHGIGKMTIIYREPYNAKVVVQQLDEARNGDRSILRGIRTSEIDAYDVSDALMQFWRNLNQYEQSLPQEIDDMVYLIPLREPTDQYSASVVVNLASARLNSNGNGIDILWGFVPPKKKAPIPNPLHFGTMDFRPELVPVLPLTKKVNPVTPRPTLDEAIAGFFTNFWTMDDVKDATKLMPLRPLPPMLMKKVPVPKERLEREQAISDAMRDGVAGALYRKHFLGTPALKSSDPSGELKKSIDAFVETLKDDFPVGRVIPNSTKIQVALDGTIEVYLAEPKRETKVKIIAPDGQVTEATLIIDPSLAFVPGAGLLEKPTIPSMQAHHDPSVSQADKNVGRAFGYRED